MILGGGTDNGFSLDTIVINVQTLQIDSKTYPKMVKGIDLRNKIVKHENNIYAIGGNNYVCSCLSLESKKWKLLNSYSNLVEDNLDSWCCAKSILCTPSNSKNIF